MNSRSLLLSLASSLLLACSGGDEPPPPASSAAPLLSSCSGRFACFLGEQLEGDVALAPAADGCAAGGATLHPGGSVSGGGPWGGLTWSGDSEQFSVCDPARSRCFSCWRFEGE